MSTVTNFNFNASLGALEFGTYVSMFLVGITTLQAWNYFRTFPEDPVSLKIMVAVVYALDLFHSIMLAYTIHSNTHSHFGRVPLIPILWSLDCALLTEGFIIVIVQCFLGLRVLRITASRILSFGIWILAAVRLCLTISLTVTAQRGGTLAVIPTGSFRWQNSLATAIGAFTDICTALALCIGLMRLRTGFSRSDKLIDKLVAYTVGSGFLTSIISVAQLISYLTMSDNFVWVAFFSVAAKLFSNSLLASLNQRGSFERPSTLNVTDGKGTRLTFEHPTRESVEMKSFPIRASATEADSV